jgi:hypothetical protein
MIVKVLLIASVVAVSLWLLRGHRRGGRLALTRLVGIGFAVCWVVAVLAPGSVTRLANLIGVGRGADLLLYGLIVAFMFTTVSLYQHIRHLNDTVSQLTREQALLEHAFRTETTNEIGQDL